MKPRNFLPHIKVAQCFSIKLWLTTGKKYTMKSCLYRIIVLHYVIFRSEKVVFSSNVSLQLLSLSHHLNHKTKNCQWYTKPTNLSCTFVVLLFITL